MDIDVHRSIIYLFNGTFIGALIYVSDGGQWASQPNSHTKCSLS